MPDDAPGAKVFNALAAARAELDAAGRLACGNCGRRVERNGSLVCGLHGWLVQPTDPDCGAWESPPESYNEGVVHRVSIGGVE
jgi:hypothetical protein